jgi:plastocyanin
LSAPKKESTAAGIIIAVLAVAAIGSIGYFQFELAPGLYASSSTSSRATGLVAGEYVNVTIPNGAATPPEGYTAGAKTQFGYSPDVITVVIGKNSTVNWVNEDIAPHTATSDSAGIFDSGTIPPGGTYFFNFTTPGTYTYHCSFHSWMQGTVNVVRG